MSEIATAIDTIIRLGLANVLKQAGYRKAGRTFHFVDEQLIRVVNIQGSQANVGASGRFTLNLGVYFPSVKEIMEDHPIIGRPKEYECQLRSRIGGLMPGHADVWWHVDQTADLQAMAGETVEAWTAYGEPWIRRCSDLREARSFAIQTENYLLAAAISLVLQEREQAQHWFDAWLSSNRDAPRFPPLWSEKFGLSYQH